MKIDYVSPLNETTDKREVCAACAFNGEQPTMRCLLEKNKRCATVPQNMKKIHKKKVND